MFIWFGSFFGWGLLNVCGDHIFTATVGDAKANPYSLCVVAIKIPCATRTNKPLLYCLGACGLPASFDLAHHINHGVEGTAGINPEVVCVLPHETLDRGEGDFLLGFRRRCGGCFHMRNLYHPAQLVKDYLTLF